MNKPDWSGHCDACGSHEPDDCVIYFSYHVCALCREAHFKDGEYSKADVEKILKRAWKEREGM